MATQLFKKIPGGWEESWPEAERVANMLANGWLIAKEEASVAPDDINEDAPTEEEADTNNTGKLSNQEVRQAAKKAGIADWDSSRIRNLKKVLGYDQG